MHLDRNPLMCSWKEGGSLNIFKFGSSLGHFLSDSATNTAVKGLKLRSVIVQDFRSPLFPSVLPEVINSIVIVLTGLDVHHKVLLPVRAGQV